MNKVSGKSYNGMKVGEFRGKVLNELEHIKVNTVKIQEDIKDNEDRISNLENKWFYATGLASGIGALAGFLANLVFN